jgi:hypothetical protein
MTARARTLGLSVPVTEVLDPELWRTRYAYGLVLGDVRRRGTLSGRVDDALQADEDAEAIKEVISGISPDTIRWHLKCALSELEMTLGIPMGVEIVKSVPVDDGLVEGVDYDRTIQRLPYTFSETLQWFRIDLPDASILSVERIRGYYYGTKVWEFSGANMEQVRLEWPKEGVLHILPIGHQGIIVSTPYGGGNYGIWHTINLHRSPVPDFWSIDYTTGPRARDGKIGNIETVLAHWCYATASIPLLSIGGLAASKGLSSTSVSMEGVSRSVGLQASAIYGLNSALEHVYEQIIKRVDLKRIRTMKRGLSIKPFGY